MREISRSISVPRWLRSVTLAAAAALLLITAPAQRADAVSLIAPGGTPAAKTASDALILVRDGHGEADSMVVDSTVEAFTAAGMAAVSATAASTALALIASSTSIASITAASSTAATTPTTAIITTRTAGSPITDRGASAAGIAGIIAAIGEMCEKVHAAPSGALFRLRHCERSEAIDLVTTEAWIA